MRPLLQRASRSIFTNATIEASPQWIRSLTGSFTKPVLKRPTICIQCQFWPIAPLSCIASAKQSRRQMSISRKLFEEKKPSDPSEFLPPRTSLPPRNDAPPSTIAATPPPSPPPSPKAEDTSAHTRVQDTIARVPAEDLPSHREGQRWSLSKRLSELMDDLLPKLAIVTQKVNTYTGTDYSGIEALRREIKDQGTVSGTHIKGRRLTVV
jgi:sensitive to high expression protein 9